MSALQRLHGKGEPECPRCGGPGLLHLQYQDYNRKAKQYQKQYEKYKQQYNSL
jgi:hypothetical protein